MRNDICVARDQLKKWVSCLRNNDALLVMAPCVRRDDGWASS
jgi:hypothetical protein